MIRGAVIRGLEPLLVDVEVGIDRNATGFRIVGLGRTEVKESQERLKSALNASGFRWPTGAVTVNLAPAGIPKGGTSLDLAIALALLETSGQFRRRVDDPVIAVGELGLSGNVRRIDGALSVARHIPERSTLIAPTANQHELAILRQMEHANKEYRPYVVKKLREAVEVVCGNAKPLARTSKDKLEDAVGRGTDFAEIKGQQRAKRALEVAAAGGHNVLLIGPPGEGKSLLAKGVPTVLPLLTPSEIIELTSIYSAMGSLPSNNSIVEWRPYRKVHHTASRQSLVGGGSGFPKPGEITLAHRGVLFLDELPEFGRGLLETLRQPLEDGVISLQRKDGRAEYPCELILVAAMNPCPCGLDGEFLCKECGRKLTVQHRTCPDCNSADRQSRCTCTEHEKRAYKSRLSGPIMDRIDLKIRVGGLSPEERFGNNSQERSRKIRRRVQDAREVQRRRFDDQQFYVNARIPGGKVDQYCELQPSAQAAMREVAKRVPELTTRGHDKLLKVSRTIADLNNSRLIYKKHIAEAAELCGHEEVREFLATERDMRACPACGESVEPRYRFCPYCGHSVR